MMLSVLLGLKRRQQNGGFTQVHSLYLFIEKFLVFELRFYCPVAPSSGKPIAFILNRIDINA